eukprot:13844896-Ditylum_brightwellii.AAC.1
MAIILCCQYVHTSFDQEITAKTTRPNYKEGVSALKLVTIHLSDIPSKRVEALRLLNVEEHNAWRK